MNPYLKLKKSNCKNCYKCIRHCPVKSIRFSDDQAYILEEDCILCGNCFVVCPQNAKEVRQDVHRIQAALAQGRPVYASIAPSFVAHYPGLTITSMDKTLKLLGFVSATETAIGATIIKDKYQEMIQEHRQNVIISSCCHTVNTMIQKYYPQVIKNVAAIYSPMQAHCAYLKAQNPDAFTVFIGPCISKKEEGDLYPGIVDCVLTFEELSQWMEEKELFFDLIGDEIPAGRSRHFPAPGGILRSMDCNANDYTYISIDGMDNCLYAIQDILSGHVENCFIEMSACAGSCINGPVMGRNRLYPVRDSLAVQKYAGQEDFYVQETPRSLLGDMDKAMPSRKNFQIKPSEEELQKILSDMGKSSPDMELNCGSCGYNTCRDKALAVFRGKADLTMCLPFLKEKAESFSGQIIQNTPNGILVLNENLEVQQINQAACRILNLRSPKDVTGSSVVRVLDPSPYEKAMAEKRNLKKHLVYLTEYHRYVEEIVVYDSVYRTLMILLRDVTDEQEARLKKEEVLQQTADIADKVVEKQMRVVQEIAFLLGETAAETKVALTKLKETMGHE